MPRVAGSQLGRALSGLCCAALASAACEPSTVPGGGVQAVFGEPGLAWGAFSYPRAIAADAAGRVYVVDKSGRIQRFTPDGQFEFGWKMPETRSGKPIGLTVHPDGRLFVADTHYHRVLVFEVTGHQTTEVARFGEQGTGPGQMLLPTDVAVDREGLIYVSEYGGNDRITCWSPELHFLRALADTAIEGRRLNRPAGLAIDGDDLWVADACNHRIVRLSRDGAVRAVFGSVGTAPGQLRWPYDIHVCADGSLLVSEFGNHRVQWLSATGRSQRVWGAPGRAPGQLNSPWGAIELAGRTYVLDSMNNRVQVTDR